MARAKVSKEAQERVSAKIRHLRREEGLSTKESAGKAYGMERAGRLGPKGAYRKVHRGGRRSSR